ncbi:MAG TPA: YceI family protein [Steroidobacter sp.]
MRSRCLFIALGACGMASMAVAAPEVYTAEPGHTYPSFSVSHMGMTFWRAKFNKTKGQVWLDREAGTGKVDITIDTSSVNFGLPIMDKVAQGDDFFNVAKYPTATYKSDSIEFRNGVPVTVNGQLTLVGITKPVPLQIESFKCKMHPYAKREFCGVIARGQLNRVEFGMKRDAEHDPMVQLVIDMEAIKGDTEWKPPAGPPPSEKH